MSRKCHTCKLDDHKYSWEPTKGQYVEITGEYHLGSCDGWCNEYDGDMPIYLYSYGSTTIDLDKVIGITNFTYTYRATGLAAVFAGPNYTEKYRNRQVMLSGNNRIVCPKGLPEAWLRYLRK